MIACAKKPDGPTNAVPMQVSVATAGQRDVPLDDIHPYLACSGGTTTLVLRRLSRPSRYLATLLLSLSFTSLASNTLAQSREDGGKDTPLISGAAAFFTRTNGGKTTYSPVLAPLLAAPVGTHLLFESRANLVETWSPTGPNNAYDHVHFVGLTYAQVDYFLNAHVTLVGGYFLIPFGTYNERPTPLWISNLQDAPLIYSLGMWAVGAELAGRSEAAPSPTRTDRSSTIPGGARPGKGAAGSGKGATDPGSGTTRYSPGDQEKSQLDVDKYAPLAQADAVSKQDFDNANQTNVANNAKVLAAEAASASAEAQIQVNEAGVETASFNLGFTRIVSPIDGIAGVAQAQVGDLVTPAAEC